MNDISMNPALTHIKAVSIESLGKAKEVRAGGVDFASLLKQSINSVNETQQTSASLSKAFEVGDKNVSLAEVMIASQKASVAFQATLQVRNKLVDAYREVMNMPM